eukprot:5562223-Pyramimonas_sp.AAC.1
MTAKIRKFARASRRHQVTGRLERAGAQAAGSYGHQVHGSVGSHRVGVRRRLGASMGSKQKGR